MNLFQHIGKVKTPVDVAVRFTNGENLGKLVQKDDVLHCCVRRKLKEYRTRIALAEEDGRVEFDEEVIFPATLYYAPRTKSYDEKIFQIAIVNV